MSGAAGAAGRGAGSERGAAGPWGRGWPARRGGKGKRSLPSVESPVHPVVFARAVSSTVPARRAAALAARGRQLGTTHAQQRTGTASVSQSGASGGSVYAAARCASTARFVIRHLRPKRPVRGSSGFAAPARSGIRAARRNG